MDTAFNEEAAAGYEAWYETAEGARADELEKAVLQHALRELPKGAEILEVGCGTGHFTRWLDDQAWSAVGLDLSGPMLSEAQALNGTPLVQADALRLPFGDGAFDLAAFVTTLEFLEQPQAALAEAARVSEWGIVLGVLNRWSTLSLRRRVRGLFRPTVYDGAQFYGVDSLDKLVRRAVNGIRRVSWRTTLFVPWACGMRPPRWLQDRLPWGGFIAMTVELRS